MKKLLIALVIVVSVMSLSNTTCDLKQSKKLYERVCIGTFKVTAYNYYEGGNYQTTSGRTPLPYYTVATDPDVIPTGTVFYIEGIGKVRADDTGGAIKGNIIDYHIGYDDCDSFGVKYLKVYMRKEKHGL